MTDLHARRMEAINKPLEPKRGSKWSHWQSPRQKNYLLGCCDCGLYHWFDFRVDADGDVQYRVARAPHYTKTARRKHRYNFRRAS